MTRFLYQWNQGFMQIGSTLAAVILKYYPEKYDYVYSIWTLRWLLVYGIPWVSFTVVLRSVNPEYQYTNIQISV